MCSLLLTSEEGHHQSVGGVAPRHRWQMGKVEGQETEPEKNSKDRTAGCAEGDQNGES